MTGWVLVALLVSAYDARALATGTPTMSTAYRSAFRSRPALIGGATAFMVAHLTGAIPPRFDPLRRVA